MWFKSATFVCVLKNSKTLCLQQAFHTLSLLPPKEQSIALLAWKDTCFTLPAGLRLSQLLV